MNAVPARPTVALMLDLLVSPAGAERAVLALALALPDAGFDLTVITTRAAGGWPLDALAAAGVRHRGFHRTRSLDARPLLALRRFLREERIDVLHTHMYGSNVWGSVLGRSAGVPVVVAHEHSWPYAGDPVRRVLDGAIGRTVDAFVAVSRSDAALMRSYERVPADRIRVIPSAWSPRPKGDPAQLRAELGIPADALVVGTVALLRPVKRIDRIIEAFATVRAQVPDVWLLIGGDGEERRNIEAAGRAHGIADRMVITGLREDVGTVWGAIDVAAMASEREGTPTAALEAMASGVPMIAPSVGGIPDVLRDGAGVLVAPGDVEALAAGIVELLQDPRRRAAIAAVAARRADDYTLERQVGRCASLYRELLASPRAGRRLARRERRRRGIAA